VSGARWGVDPEAQRIVDKLAREARERLEQEALDHKADAWLAERNRRDKPRKLGARRFDGWLVVVATGSMLAWAGSALSSRDRDRTTTALRAEVATLRASLAQPLPADPRTSQLVQRTEWLREVLRVLVREELIEGRATLPDPPPGWPAITLSSDGPSKNTGKRAWREGLR
jgi:hypothetical protein